MSCAEMWDFMVNQAGWTLPAAFAVFAIMCASLDKLNMDRYRNGES